jgi:hypothetical protein
VADEKKKKKKYSFIAHFREINRCYKLLARHGVSSVRVDLCALHSTKKEEKEEEKDTKLVCVVVVYSLYLLYDEGEKERRRR